MEKKPVLYDYFDYREYLNDIFSYFKKNDSTYSHRKFLAEAEIPGSTYLLRVINSERKLSLKYVANFSKSIQHDPAEASYFELLVKFNNEKNVDKKDQLLKELLKIRSEKTTSSIEDKKLKYFEKWYYPVIRDLVGIVENSDDYNALSRMLIPPMSPQQVKRAVAFLLKNGFIKQRENGNGYIPSEPIFSTPPSVNSTILSQFHKKNLELDIDAFENFSLSDRSISSVIMSISTETFEKMRLEIQEFRKRLLVLAREDTKPTMVCRVGFQVVPRAKVKKKEQ
ncbi:MAG TPA: TIGR02147 family protein [Chitinispirillaceae bacterium]|nr:TIGR02147 family protein [Chitinispirillaceae bacterium]